MTKLALGALGIFALVRFVHELHGFGLVIATVVAFVILAIFHEFVLRRIRKIDALIAFYERGLARLEDRWAGTGEGGDQYITDAHPYARDLDLFGKGSMFELLCAFRTRAGQDKLARWLLEPALPVEVESRRCAVQELTDRLQFREELFTAGNTVRMGLHPESLVAWAEQKLPPQSRAVLFVAIPLIALGTWSIVFALTGGSYWPVPLIYIINSAVNREFRKRLKDADSGVGSATDDLDLLATVLRIIEKENFCDGRLRNLQRSLQANGLAASAAIGQLDRINSYLEQQGNMIVRFVDGFVFYTVLCTLWAESWRRKFGPLVRTWLDAVGEVESLAALSCYAFEHPDDAWPEFCEEGPLFEAERLAHPLLPEKQAVRNDIKLGGDLRLIVLSGPNMSGKSTFVRGIGINAVLAQCGAPVCARRLRMSSLAVGTSICVLDSLQGGVSRFYAEIKRLKTIADLTGSPMPVLFLLDELLSGTNSQDRLRGSEMLVRTLVEHGAIGFITTHDLALARIPESMNGQAGNYHFDDHLEDGKLRFDFKLKEGIVQSSNALRLMESIGLLKS
ncbi:MAG: MutS-related protein [Terracidiphilus sp.]